jgi:hypothetical protein
MGNDQATLPGACACAQGAEPVLSTPTSRLASFEAKRRRAGAARLIEGGLPGGAAFLIADHHRGKYPTLFKPTNAAGSSLLAGSDAGHPHAG